MKVRLKRSFLKLFLMKLVNLMLKRQYTIFQKFAGIYMKFIFLMIKRFLLLFLAVRSNVTGSFEYSCHGAVCELIGKHENSYESSSGFKQDHTVGSFPCLQGIYNHTVI